MITSPVVTLFGALLALALSLSTLTLSATPAQASDAYNSITSASASNVDWMSRVADGTSLSWLSMPGTHDSLALCGERDPKTGQCGGIATSITQTQENHGFSAETLTTQFRAGIRALEVVSTDATTVQLTWSGSAQAAGYRVWIRNINNSSQSTADESVISETNHGIAFLVPGTWNYEFCMTAVNGALESGKSNCVVAPRPAGS